MDNNFKDLPKSYWLDSTPDTNYPSLGGYKCRYSYNWWRFGWFKYCLFVAKRRFENYNFRG